MFELYFQLEMESRTKMNFHGLMTKSGIMLGMAMVISGCTTPNPIAATETPVQAVGGCESNKVTVTNVHWFKDAVGAWRVVGVINNGSSEAVSKVVTGVETMTKDNQPVDQGEDVSAYPLDLQPGASAPFTAWIDREIPGLDHFVVEVDECVLAEQEERSEVDVRGGQMLVDDKGAAQVTAELYNPGLKTVLVNGLIAAVYDQAGILITAEYVVVGPRYLAPGESGPVRATLDLPPGGAAIVKSYQFFRDVLVNQPGAPSLDVNHDVQIISHYLDANGHFHLIGQITNPGSTDLMTSLQATVYSDSTRSRVMDADDFTTWIPMEPGETLPFDMTEWGPLNNVSGLWDTIAQKSTITVRLEPFLTWTAEARVSKLSSENNSVSFSNHQAIFTGKVINNLSSSIINGQVTAVVRQKPGEEIVATGTLHLDISDPAAPGQVINYYFDVSLPINLDPATLETEVTAWGQQP
ncbi:MAG: hypothetical protein ACXWNC_02235 [Anaerolineales bacterium]